MENNKLKDEIKNILLDANHPSDRIYTLTKDVAVAFKTWWDECSISLKKYLILTTTATGSDKELFQYFIQKIYKQ